MSGFLECVPARYIRAVGATHDFADACAVVLAHNYERAFVSTTDFRDFSTYRVPFASPEGAFHV
jgi:hypothetical protein